MSQAGLQQAEVAFQSMLSGEQQPDTQQQLDEQVPEEAEVEAEDTEIEAESEVEAEEEEPEEAEQEPDGTEYHRVKLDGTEYEVTLDEALAGYQRQQDYTKKNASTCRRKETSASGTGSCKTG